jgi:hypothetical protein
MKPLRACAFFVLFVSFVVPSLAADGEDDAAERRLELMAQRAGRFSFLSEDPDFPDALEDTPLFRYDDQTRGIVDGTVWRLGAKGRPKAVVTTELHPSYYGSPCVVYDFLSLCDTPFRAAGGGIRGWRPSASAVTFQSLPDGPEPAATAKARLFQLKRLARRFAGRQQLDEDGIEQDVRLRLLPRPIDRYTPPGSERADGAMFLLVSGRNPAVVLLIETDGRAWTYAAGRLTAPSELTLSLDGATVWKLPRSAYIDNAPYTATNVPASIPGYER